MSFCRPIILCCLVLMCYVNGAAQDTNYVYRDTSLLKINAEDTVAQDGNADDDESYEADTVLKNNLLVIEPDSVAALKRSKPFAYAKNLDSLLAAYQLSLRKQQQPERKTLSWLEAILLSPFTRYFFWLLAGAFILFILNKLYFTEGFFQRPSAKTSVTALPDEAEHLLADTDYSTLIAKAVSTGNYRMAVRYQYLQTLQRLAAKGLIEFAPEKTNYQYVLELSGKPYKNAFASVTLHYEYVWYGEFEIDANIYEMVQTKFKQFNSGV